MVQWPGAPAQLRTCYGCISSLARVMPSPARLTLPAPPLLAVVEQVSKLLVYSPTQRMTALEAIRHPFFDELRDPACRLPNGGCNSLLPRCFGRCAEDSARI